MPGSAGSGEAYRCIHGTDHHGIHTDIVALPFCHIVLKAQKPVSPAYPKSLKSLGDHLRKRRLDLHLLQREVAAKIGVDKATIFNWENSNTTPSLSSTPKVIAFLGYNPDASKEKTLGAEIKKARRIRGWSQKKLARFLRVDPSTLGQWERGEAQPMKRSCKIIHRLKQCGI